MDKDQQLFTHKSVDDDIDQLINTRSSLSSDLDARLVYELRHVYKEDVDSLKRVWERLEHYDKQQHTSQELSPQTPQRLAMGSQIIPFKRRSSSNNTNYPVNQLFTVLAATIVGIFLVSSMAWVLAITHPATLGAVHRIPAIPEATSNNVSNRVELTVHNNMSGQINYLLLTYKGNHGKTDHVFCQPIPPLNWVDVQSSPGVPAEIQPGQTIWLRYFHSNKCNPSSRFLSVGLPIPAVPVYNHCWFNPDNTTTPNWSGCVSHPQVLRIS
jgi:hypothetical protein